MDRASLEDYCLMEVVRYLNLALMNCEQTNLVASMIKSVMEIEFSEFDPSELEEPDLPRLLAQGILIQVNERTLAAELEFNYGDFCACA
jgi:hypothetical protein